MRCVAPRRPTYPKIIKIGRLDYRRSKVKFLAKNEAHCQSSPATMADDFRRSETAIRHPQAFRLTYPKTKQIQRSNLRRSDFKHPPEIAKKPIKIETKHLPPCRSGVLNGESEVNLRERTREIKRKSEREIILGREAARAPPFSFYIFYFFIYIIILIYLFFSELNY